ncbi:hypothetical protein DICPUDRAFT_80316 [Dictyostelium purpureum]|uniref:G domain-containing protein n=1 Tax=Dictyostelium purpureum TaxID=5786 RepID=F0ZQ50_DICPU|nr:uncharacterized protein DICPUDRAFT_80316 [Dictyostelium purpureum]EGC33923.1 hypothetical protein DICPUDRAFT_80316 [Dictyostelium purpureum]|eukprot:XP_003289558.1 hypothetical protein DICPUDRAFT_80316 [Dictyostelium purpureum]
MNSEYEILSIPINNNNNLNSLNSLTNIFSDNDGYYDMDEIKNKRFETINIGVYGDAGVGKTSLINAVLGTSFEENQVQNIENSGYRVLFKMGDIKKYELILHDISIDHNYLVPENVMEMDAFIIMFSMDSRISLDNCEKYLDYIKMYKVQIDPPIIMVGGKTDILYETTHENNNINNNSYNKAIQLNQAIQTSQFLNLKFQDCSIKNNVYSIVSVFNVLLLEYERKKNDNHNNNNHIHNNFNNFNFNNFNNNNNNNNTNYNFIKSKYKKLKKLFFNKLNNS